MRKLRPEAGFSQLLQKIAPPGLNFCTPKKKLPAGKLFHAESLTFADYVVGIYEENISKAGAEDKIRAWMLRVRNSGLTAFNSFLSTLGRRWEEITNYFIDRQTSGFVEGLNNKIKVLKRRCYGIINIGHLFQRIMLDLKGYSLFA
ncbi:transposase [Desulfonema ishimotonii]|uniref:transposase n=1 Tax=Desulfonema ishimotonii TaxID=45657 RepID=UPI0026C675E4